MSKSDKKLLCWLVGTLFVLILLGVIFGVSSVRESFSNLDEFNGKDTNSSTTETSYLFGNYRDNKGTFEDATTTFEDATKEYEEAKTEFLLVKDEIIDRIEEYLSYCREEGKEVGHTNLWRKSNTDLANLVIKLFDAIQDDENNQELDNLILQDYVYAMYVQIKDDFERDDGVDAASDDKLVDKAKSWLKIESNNRAKPPYEGCPITTTTMSPGQSKVISCPYKDLDSGDTMTVISTRGASGNEFKEKACDRLEINKDDTLTVWHDKAFAEGNNVWVWALKENDESGIIPVYYNGSSYLKTDFNNNNKDLIDLLNMRPDEPATTTRDPDAAPSGDAKKAMQLEMDELECESRRHLQSKLDMADDLDDAEKERLERCLHIKNTLTGRIKSGWAWPKSEFLDLVNVNATNL